MVGVLAFHGDVAEHMEVLRSLKADAMEVRSIDDLSHCSHLIIPGGESTVMGKFLVESGLGSVIRKRAKAGSLAIYGTCAGAILLAAKVTGKNAPKTLNLLSITVERNAYGSQLQSFEALLTIKNLKSPVAASFIRAPKITKVGKGITVLASLHKDPVLVQQGRVLAGTFHPEVRGETAIHQLFLDL